jgi:addiction module HigA family antidote
MPLTMPMKNPPHPGRIVRQEYLAPLGFSVTGGAKALGVSRYTLSELVDERRGISPEMAIRLAKAFGNSAEVWTGLQIDYGMTQAMKHAHRINVRRVAQAPASAE